MPPAGAKAFTAQQCRAYNHFLDTVVEETFISYQQLKKRYGRHVRAADRTVLQENGGFFAILGIKKDTKFRECLHAEVGLPLESLRGKAVIPVYQGIWYEPTTRQYLVGSKNAYQEEQERGFVLRQLWVHQGATDEAALLRLVSRDLFPLLEVNFIRYREYTVYPFPFRLIDIWQEIQGQTEEAIADED